MEMHPCWMVFANTKKTGKRKLRCICTDEEQGWNALQVIMERTDLYQNVFMSEGAAVTDVMAPFQIHTKSVLEGEVE